MIDPTGKHFDGPLAPLEGAIYVKGPGTIEDLHQIREREGEETWQEYWEHVETIVTGHLVDKCLLLDEIAIDVIVMEDFAGAKYLQTQIRSNPNTTLPRDREGEWDLN